MKILGISAVAGLLVLLASALQAQACRCTVTEDPLQAFSQADVVVYGSVWKIDGSLASNDGQTVTFLSEVTWKRAPATKVTFVNRTTCAMELTESETYLLFLHEIPATGELSANRCFGSLSGKAAEDAVKLLQEKAASDGTASAIFTAQRNNRCGPSFFRNACGTSPAQQTAPAAPPQQDQ